MTDTRVSLGEQFHDPNGCHWGGRPHLGPCRDRSREAGNALTQMRTVLSWARTAQRFLLDNRAGTRNGPIERRRGWKPPAPAGVVDTSEPPYLPDGQPFDDPDHAYMLAALRQVITALSPWQRGPGRTTGWVSPGGPAQLVVSGPPDLYEDEVGDEQFMAVQAVLAQLRQRLAGHLGFDTATTLAVIQVVDDFTRELVDEQREGDDGEDDCEDCGAVYVDPARPDRPAPPPCGKPAGHWLGPDTDWKRDYHSNGSWKWPVTDEERAAWR